MKQQWLQRLLMLAVLPLAACGSDTDTVVEEREVPVEVMPVNGNTLGFWTMQPQACEAASALCINDNSPYDNDLVLEDSALQPLSERDWLRGASEFGGQRIQLNGADMTPAAQLRTAPLAVFAATPIGEVFAIHLSFRPAAVEPLQTVLSLGTGVLNIEASQDSVVVQFPAQGKRLLLALDTTADWQQLYVVSDGQNVSAQLNCQQGPGFSKLAGAPMLSRSGSALMLGARPGTPTREHFSGELSLLRLANVNEANLFCQ